MSGIGCQQCDTKLQAYTRLFSQVLWYELKTTKRFIYLAGYSMFLHLPAPI